MPCDSRLKPGQTISQRKAEVRKVLDTVAAKLAARTATAVINKANGAVAFAGLTQEERNDVTDACVYRLLMATGSASAKMAIARAEALAGRSISRQALAAGMHGHANAHGGITWHDHKG